MSAPKRIQLRRTKGWRKPEGAIKVDRTTRWGNRWVVQRIGERYAKVPRYVAALPDPAAFVVAHVDKWGNRDGIQFGGFTSKADATAFAVDVHARSLRATALDLDGLLQIEHWLAPLRGHDLACWCPLDQPCHADVLLELANREPS